MKYDRGDLDRIMDETAFAGIDPTEFNPDTNQYISKVDGSVVMTAEECDGEIIDIMQRMEIPIEHQQMIDIPRNLLDMDFAFYRLMYELNELAAPCSEGKSRWKSVAWKISLGYALITSLLYILHYFGIVL